MYMYSSHILSCVCLYYALCFCLTALLRCFYVFFSRLPLLLRFKSYQQQQQRRAEATTHTY